MTAKSANVSPTFPLCVVWKSEQKTVLRQPWTFELWTCCRKRMVVRTCETAHLWGLNREYFTQRFPEVVFWKFSLATKDNLSSSEGLGELLAKTEKLSEKSSLQASIQNCTSHSHRERSPDSFRHNGLDEIWLSFSTGRFSEPCLLKSFIKSRKWRHF